MKGVIEHNPGVCLHGWIKQRTGLDVPVHPILTLPGWFVHERRGMGMRVVNSKILPAVIRESGERVLTGEQIDLIAAADPLDRSAPRQCFVRQNMRDEPMALPSRQLDLVCRDVED